MYVGEVDKDDLIGEQFGFLEVLSFKIGKLGGVKCLCKCKCGSEAEVTLYNLCNKIYTSCGCASKKRGDRPKKHYVSPAEQMLARPDHLKRNHPLYRG